MKFSTAWYYFQAATWGGDYLECNIDDMCKPPDAEMYFLHHRVKKEWRTIKLVALGNPLRCSAVELSHDFTKAMERIQFDAFSKSTHALIPEFKDAFMKFLVAEKRRQMAVDSVALPEVPWNVENIWSMPMVLWFRRAPS